MPRFEYTREKNDKNKVLIEKTFKYFGADFNDSYHLGTGNFGSAYLCRTEGSDIYWNVLKFTDDESEAVIANSLIGKKLKHIVNFYRVAKLNTKDDFFKYVLVKEFVEDINLDFSRDYLDDCVDCFYDYIYYKNEEKFKECVDDDKIFNNFIGLANEMEKLNISSEDIHSNNLGITEDGVIKVFDFGIANAKNPKDSYEYINLSENSEEIRKYAVKRLSDWKNGKKPELKGGYFVDVKEKCRKFPYCNQGDINAIKLSKKKS